MDKTLGIREVGMKELDRDPSLLWTSVDSFREIDRGHPTCPNSPVELIRSDSMSLKRRHTPDRR